ncbi:MAG: hypothetical protein P4L33_20895 [Capsulimonadaceae bacterium]|nr:hypothetical protein [Capsulimonadaceae bacterium]
MSGPSTAIPACAKPSTAYHATPLHYLPSILADGALYAKDVMISRGILPRSSAVRRDRMLGLGCYIHFALRLESPLLLDKLRKGYPHVVLEFDAASLVRLAGSGSIATNTKAWRSKSCFDVSPVCETGDLKPLAHGRLPSRELLVKYAADLDGLKKIVFTSPEERALVDELMRSLGVAIHLPCPTRAYAGIAYRPLYMDQVTNYFRACAAAGVVLKPPDIPFD